MVMRNAWLFRVDELDVDERMSQGVATAAIESVPVSIA